MGEGFIRFLFLGEAEAGKERQSPEEGKVVKGERRGNEESMVFVDSSCVEETSRGSVNSRARNFKRLI
jgi:hypothetical protein